MFKLLKTVALLVVTILTLPMTVGLNLILTGKCGFQEG